MTALLALTSFLPIAPMALLHTPPFLAPQQRSIMRVSTLQLSAPGTIVGIDLGTTSSAIAVIIDSEPEIVPDAEGCRSLPSIVEFKPDGSTVVGSEAGPEGLASCKRLIGRSFSEASSTAAARELFGKSLVCLPGGDVGLRLDGERVCSPVEVATEVLCALLDQAEEQCGVRAERAVLCVPAQFPEVARAATLGAAERCGLAKVRLLEEPVAAALAYGVGRRAGDELVMVVDLGGGTLDVSLLRVGGGTAEVLSSAGDQWLGGDDFDVAIAKYLAASGEIVDEATGEPVDERSGALRSVARRLKEQLTVAKVAEVPLPAGLVKLADVAPEGVLGSGDGERRGKDRRGKKPRGEEGGGEGREQVELLLDASSLAIDVAEFEARARAGEFGGLLLDSHGLVEEEEGSQREEEEADEEDEDGEVDEEEDEAEDDVQRGATADMNVVSMTRAGLEAACADLLQRMREPILKACAQAQVPLPGAAAGAAARAAAGTSKGALARPSMKGQRVDIVLRVGAASRMPAVGSLLEALTGVKCPIGTVRPEHAVALGAAVQAGVLEGSVEQLDVFSPFEAALIRGIATGSGKRSQRERTGEPSGSRRNKTKRRRS